jgi:hypothetical protein
MRRTTMLAWGAAALLAATPAAALAHGDRDHDHGGATVGTVASFADGTLTLTLADGSTLAAKVTDRTDIDCHRAATARSARKHGRHKGHRHGRGHDDGHRHGPGRGHRRHHHGDDCTTADLTAGTAVREATVRATAAGAVFSEVELVK